MGAQAVDARRPRGERLLVLSLRHTLGHLLRRSLALWHNLLSLGGLVSLRAVVVYCQRLSVSPTHMSIGCTTAHLPDGFGDDWPEDWSTDWCERFVFLENIEGIAGWCVELLLGRCRMELAGRRQRWPQLRITTAINNRRPGLAVLRTLSRKWRVYPGKTALRIVGHACFK
jgi:hypothetical protein